MSTTLARGQYLIDGYLDLIDQHLMDVEYMRRYLWQREGKSIYHIAVDADHP